MRCGVGKNNGNMPGLSCVKICCTHIGIVRRGSSSRTTCIGRCLAFHSWQSSLNEYPFYSTTGYAYKGCGIYIDRHGLKGMRL